MGWVSLVLFLAALLLPSAVRAASPPTGLNVVPTVDGHLSATWSLPSGTSTDFVDVSAGQRVDSLGEFDPYLVFDTSLDPAAQSWTSSDAFPSGTYYVHVGAFEAANCVTGVEPECEEFSDIAEVTVPGPVPVLDPPVIQSLEQSGRHITASWTLPDTRNADLVEVAKASDTYPLGAFKVENLVHFEYLPDPQQTSYFSTAQLAPGTYWVHVAALPALDPVKCPTLAEIACLIDEYSETNSVTIPPDPTPGGGGGGGSSGGSTGSQQPTSKPTPVVVDKATAFAKLSAASTQDVDKLFVLASMGEAGTITAGGTVSVPSLSKVYKFKTESVDATPGASVKLKLKLPKKALKAVKRALKRHKKLKAKLTITARDKAGNTKTAKRTVSLKP
jgi:hypothetical protein